MNGKRTYVSFDWALKRLLRDKANFGVLEGFISTLLDKDLKINRLLESESNREHADTKQNRVDILAEDTSGALYIIEVQNNNEYDFFQRMLFATSKVTAEYLTKGDEYERLRKVYSINIVYFDLGVGTDTVYRGKTTFVGIHNNDILNLSHIQQQKFGVEKVCDIFPEYFILKANDFDRWSKTPLDQWIYFLSTSEIPADATAPGLQEARERMRVDALSPSEKAAYEDHMDNMRSWRVQYETAHLEGREEGLKEGREEGLKEGREKGLKEGREEGLKEGHGKAILEMVPKMAAQGMTAEQISAVTNLTAGQIEEMLSQT